MLQGTAEREKFKGSRREDRIVEAAMSCGQSHRRREINAEKSQHKGRHIDFQLLTRAAASRSHKRKVLKTRFR